MFTIFLKNSEYSKKNFRNLLLKLIGDRLTDTKRERDRQTDRQKQRDRERNTINNFEWIRIQIT